MKTMLEIKYLKSILLIISIMLFTSCSKNSSMKPEDFKNKEPRLIIENYLSGNVKAWGVLQNRSGKVTRQFSADLNGKWDGKQLTLDEKFNWDDGEIQTRQWQINKIDDNNYEGTAGDVVGKAKGVASGNALNWRYKLNLKVKDSTIVVDFDDWMFLQDKGVLINRAEVKKWGLNIGVVTITFLKVD